MRNSKPFASFLHWVRSLIENEHDLDEMEELRREYRGDGVRVSVRTEAVNVAHTTFRVFVNGASAGLLIVRRSEAAAIRARLEGNCKPSRRDSR